VKLKPFLLIAVLGFAPFASATSTEMQEIDGFLIDRTEVPVGTFRQFAKETGFVTKAEKTGGGLVFGKGWERKSGWTWSSPYGTPARDDEPAVHITFDEAAAFCKWAGKRLPKDYEWVKAAYTETRPGPPPPFRTGAVYDYPTGLSPHGANCLDDCGTAPAINYRSRLDRGAGHAAVGTTRAGVNGLYDMGANVWEWTENGGDAEKRTRGGSWWYGAFRMKAGDVATKPRDMAVVYIGFRCVKDAE
jgi:formylglycine-generating enzyme